MTASMMLKNESGEIVGFVLQRKGRLIYRIKGQGDAAGMTLLEQGEEAAELSICCDGQEHEAAYDGMQSDGAYVTIGTVPFAWSNRRAKELCALKRGHEEKKNSGKSEMECKKDDSTSVYQRDEVSGREPMRRTLPERRWPPPVCWPQARYGSGVWGETEVGG